MAVAAGLGAAAARLGTGFFAAGFGAADFFATGVFLATAFFFTAGLAFLAAGLAFFPPTGLSFFLAAGWAAGLAFFTTDFFFFVASFRPAGAFAVFLFFAGVRFFALAICCLLLNVGTYSATLVVSACAVRLNRAGRCGLQLVQS